MTKKNSRSNQIRKIIKMLKAGDKPDPSSPDDPGKNKRRNLAKKIRRHSTPYW